MGKPLFVCEYAWLYGVTFTFNFNADPGSGLYVHTATLSFDLQDAARISLGRQKVSLHLAETEARLSVPEMLTMMAGLETAAAIEAAVARAKADFAGYAPAPEGP